MVEKALTDTSIDLRVFGMEAAAHLEMARYHYEHGDAQQAGLALSNAVQTARSSSCPAGFSDSLGGTTDRESGSNDETGDCEFISKECPLCHKKNVKTVVKSIGKGKKRISGACGCYKVA